MIPVELSDIATITGGAVRNADQGRRVDRICIDSRAASPHALFVALPGEKVDGHSFVGEALSNGAVAALVRGDQLEAQPFADNAPLIVVQSPLRALQALATWHRRRAFDKVLAITGSNGKTIVKDALATVLTRRDVLASPGSYNSQLGLPLAVLSAERRVPLGLLEAGVSQPGEMRALKEVSAPDYGILTNIGMAHFASFGSRQAIADEKMSLFSDIPGTGWVLAPANEPTIEPHLSQLSCTVHRLGSEDDVIRLQHSSFVDEGQILQITDGSGARVAFRVLSRSPHINTDLHYAAYAAYLLGMTLHDIGEALDGYSPTPTRLETWSSPDGVRIINDAHSADPISVKAALKAASLGGTSDGRKIFVFAGMRELGAQEAFEHAQVGAYAGERRFSHLCLVGEGDLTSTTEGYLSANPDGTVLTAPNPKELKEQLLPLLKWGDTVLFKGPRNAGLVQAARELSGALSQRTLWVDLGAVADNVSKLRRSTGGRARIMAVVKALAYGTDLGNLAARLANLGLHHFGVSSTSEGIAIRKTGVDQDVYVFIPDLGDIESLVRFRLTPILFDARLVHAFIERLSASGRTMDVHLKIDTGMHRLGVEPRDVLPLARALRKSGAARLTGVCTHFAAADDPAKDDLTRAQIATFDACLAALADDGFHDLQIHAANTAGAIRFPEAHYTMVRVGLGLYGIYPSPATADAAQLSLAIGATSRIASVQKRVRGDTVGYNHSYTAPHDVEIATVPFGYYDGMPRVQPGQAHVLVEGQKAPIVGWVSMDQMQIDITNIRGAGEGAEVLIYGQHGGYELRPERLARMANTIPHELLSRLGRRVHRIYIEP